MRSGETTRRGDPAESSDPLGSIVRRARRHALPLLLLLGMALFLSDQAARNDPSRDRTTISVVEGRTSAFGPVTVSGFDERSKRFRSGLDYVMRLEEYPPNVRFRLDSQLDGDVPVGANVRLEVEDLGDTRERAARFPTATYELAAVGLAVDGRVAFSAEEERRKAEASSSAYGWAGLLFGASFALWAGLLLWSLRLDFQALLGR